MPENNPTFKYIAIGLLFLACIVGAIFIILKNRNDTKPLNSSTGSEPQKKIIIAAFGDSLTAGYGVSLEESYPSILEKRLLEKDFPVTVINMGVSGETTSGGVERVQFVLDQKPDVILLGLGANDMLRILPPSQALANLTTIIEGFKKENKKIVLLGMKASITSGLKYKGEFDDIYPTLSKKYSLPLVPFFLENVALVSELNTSDGIHPNRQGYEKIVDKNILPVLLPYLKKNF